MPRLSSWFAIKFCFLMLLGFFFWVQVTSPETYLTLELLTGTNWHMNKSKLYIWFYVNPEKSSVIYMSHITKMYLKVHDWLKAWKLDDSLETVLVVCVHRKEWRSLGPAARSSSRLNHKSLNAAAGGWGGGVQLVDLSAGGAKVSWNTVTLRPECYSFKNVLDGICRRKFEEEGARKRESHFGLMTRTAARRLSRQFTSWLLWWIMQSFS